MRTTVTLDPDVEVLLKNAVHQRKQSFKQVLNAAIREGLRRPAGKQAKPFKQRTFDLGTPLVDLTKAAALAAELDDMEMVARSRKRKRS